MRTDFPLFPEQASTFARQVDTLYWIFIAVTGAVTLLVIALIFIFAVKYRRRPGHEVPVEYEPYLWAEWAWTIIPFVIFMGMFFASARLFFRMYRPPENALEVYVTGKQWMWRAQHIGGQQEINSLHIPVGRPIKLTMASEDVIHSFYVPAFRTKTDVIPARFTITWFEATKPGRYHLFCAEYCGSEHARMIGSVYVMTPADFQNWLSGGTAEMSPAASGEKLFQQFACNTCHTNDSTARGPALAGLFGTPVRLASGQTVAADENYIRESILRPSAKVVEGFQPIMPAYQGQIDEQGLMHLLAYIKSLSSGPGSRVPGPESVPPVMNVPPEPDRLEQTPVNPETGVRDSGPGTRDPGPGTTRTNR